MSVFISYAHQDASWARRLADLLRDRTEVFLAEQDVLLGSNWPQEISLALTRSSLVIVLVSPATKHSYYQTAEIAQALELYTRFPGSKRVVPVALEPMDGLPFGLSTLQVLNTGDRSPEEIAAILQTLPEIDNQTRSAVSLIEPVTADPERYGELARFALSFLLFDQLPGGAWSRSLSTWMGRVSAGDEKSVPHRAPIRTNGGVDVTCCSLRFLNQIYALTEDEVVRRELYWFLARGHNALSAKVSKLGGIGTNAVSRTTGEDVRIRHTALVAGLLLEMQQTVSDLHSTWALQAMTGYLVDNLDRWKLDTSSLLGMYAACRRLLYLLEDAPVRPQTGVLQDCLKSALTGMGSSLDEEAYESVHAAPAHSVPFRPYGGLSRLERSSFLMNTSLLILDDIESGLMPLTHTIRSRIVDSLQSVMTEVLEPRVVSSNGLVRLRPEEPSEDWGVSSQLFGVLADHAVRTLLLNSGVTAERYLECVQPLARSLSVTFDCYRLSPMVFYYTNSYQAICCLRPIDVVAELAHAGGLVGSVRECLTEGLSERAMLQHVEQHIVLSHSSTDRESINHKAGKIQVDSDALLALLIAKLESGEYVPDGGVLCDEDKWLELIAESASPYPVDASCEMKEEWARVEWMSRVRSENGGEVLRFLAVDGSDTSAEPGQFTIKELIAGQTGTPNESLDAMILRLEVSSLLPTVRDSLMKACVQLLSYEGILMFACRLGDHRGVTRDGRFSLYVRDIEELEVLCSSWGCDVQGVSRYPRTERADSGGRAVIVSTRRADYAGADTSQDGKSVPEVSR